MSTTQGITKHGLVTTSSYSVNLGLSPPRAYSPLASGSVSDSGEQSRTPSPRRTRSRGDLTVATPFSHPSALAQTLVLPGSRSVTGSRKSSGTSQDRDAVAHLDLKRLLSKPARHNTSTSSTISLDSEASRVATRQPQINKSSTSRGTPALQVVPHTMRPPSPGDAPHSKLSRNILKRRPSARSNPATPIATHFHTVVEQTKDPLPTSAQSSPVSSQGGSPVDASAASSRSTRSTAGLTPAGAVALAYKQQEMRREELAEVSGWNDHVRRIAERTPGSGGDRRGAPVMDEEEESSGPYYTVFGSSSGRIVAVGSPGDDLWSVDPWNKPVGTDAVKVAAGSGSGSTGMRGLSRKVSGRFKKVADAVRKDKDVSQSSEFGTQGSVKLDWRPYDGQSPARDTQSDASRQTRKPPRPSVDDYVDIQAHDPQSRRATPTAKNGAPEMPSDDTTEEKRTLRVSRSGKDKDKEREEDMSPGGRWWKLMKRISTGGLRDKYHAREEPPPPVPALPPNLLAKGTVSRTTLELPKSSDPQAAGESGVLLTRFMQSRTSLSGVRPSTAPHKHSSKPSTMTRPSTAGGASSKGRASMSASRPSTTTRSSSPVSSEIASSAFFHSHKTPSTRSSFSSYGEELPPMPKANIGQYIIPPSELYRLNNKTTEDVGHTPPKKARSSRKVRSQSAPVEERMPSSQDEKRMPSLPLPPRRAGTTPREGSFLRDALPSPDIPSFSSEDTVNNFSPASASLPLSEFGVRAQADAPPPRPKRSDRRTPVNIDVPSHSVSSSMAPHPLMTPRAHPHVTVNVDVMRRPSTSAVSYASTSRQASASTSSSSPSSLSQKRSPLTFRELESPRHALTEKEKADKWEDLLARSAQAGGTLHIGDLGLPSEHLDVSDASAHDSDSYP